MAPSEKSSLSIPNLGAVSKFFLALLGILFSLSLVITPVYPNPTSSKPIKVNINGQSTLAVPANRAILSLKITASGASQVKVADEVRLATEEVLSLLRPHTVADEWNSWAPIVELSVNTFSSQSRKRPGILGEKDIFEAAVSASATFEARHELPEAIMRPAREDFDVLSVVLAKLTKMPKVRIHSLKWTIDEQTKKRALAEVRTDAMQEAVDKVRAYAKPLLGENVMVRATTFSEGWRAARDGNDLVLMDMPDEYQRSAGMHDELDGVETGKEKLEKFGLEPRVLEVKGEVEGEFEVWIPVSEAARGSFFGWLRWCYVEFSALGAKVVLRR